MLSAPREEVHVWMAELDGELGAGLEEAYLRLLDGGERERRGRFRFEKHRRQYLVSHALVRETLSRYASVAPEDWRFTTNEHGRPEVANPGLSWLRFNLTHTDGLAACAVAREVDLGVDVEDLGRRGQTLEIAESFFAASEVEGLRALPAERQRLRFFELWTLKEAYIKARGAGLSLPLRKFAFTLALGAPPSIETEPELRDEPELWRFASWRISERHQGAVAAKLGASAPGPGLEVRRWKVVPLVSAVEDDRP